jgi:Flp pilus assembly protein CpaB
MNAGHDRFRNLGTAGVLAVAAALLAAFALPHHGGAAKAQAAAAAAKSQVVVATRDLPVGTSVAEAFATGGLAVRPVAVDAVQPGALASRAATSGKVVVQQIYSGEQVTARRLGQTGQADLHADLTGAGRIVEVAGTPDQELAGTLHDGDHVDVLASVHVGANQTPTAVIAVRNLLVVSAPSSPSDTSVSTGGSGATETTVVQMTDAQAARLFFVMKNGDWSFVLRPAAKPASSKKTAVDAAALVKGD